MKELTIEQKAKAYDKKLAEAKEMLKDGGISQNTIDYIQKLYPELKESRENEMIRKAIYNCVKWFGFDSCFFKDVSQEECLAWLEEQGEQKSAEWSEEDEELCEHLIKSIEESDPLPTSIYFDCKRWLKTLKYRVGCEANCTTTKEWSEEDEIMFRKAIITIDNVRMDTGSQEYYQGICDWLKSLKDRYAWKPSDEQMELLDSICASNYLTTTNTRVLQKLYDELKKLREE